VVSEVLMIEVALEGCNQLLVRQCCFFHSYLFRSAVPRSTLF
jgi:hypothetical protein